MQFAERPRDGRQTGALLWTLCRVEVPAGGPGHAESRAMINPLFVYKKKFGGKLAPGKLPAFS